MAEKSEMSMSVQSAWEDLVVENPNRKKLEGCLLTTIMIVVLCIIALLLFVMIRLQPEGNLKEATRPTKIIDCQNGSCPEFARRLLGWVNFNGVPCEDFHSYACGGRRSEAPEEPYISTADLMATYQANYDLRNAMLRYREKQKQNYPGLPAIKGFDFLYNLYNICVDGMPDSNKTLIMLLKAKLFSQPYSGITGFQPSGSPFQFLGKMMQDLYFYPFGHLEMRNDEVHVYPMQHPASVQAFETLAGFRAEYANAFKSLSVTFSLGVPDSGDQIVKLETDLMKKEAVLSKGKDFSHDLPTLFAVKLSRDAEKMLGEVIKETYGAATTNVVYRTFGAQNLGTEIHSFVAQEGPFLNLAVFKLLQYLSPFLDYKEEKLADFFKFVSKFYWNSLEHPSRIYRCGSFLERYLQPVMQAVIFLEEGDRLAAIKLATDEALKAAEITVDPAEHPKFKKGSVFLDLLGHTVENVVYFYPENPVDYANEYMATLPAWTDTEPDGFLANLRELSKVRIENEKAKKLKWFGPFLGGEPFLDLVNDSIVLPFGFTKPPFYHDFFSAPFHHYAPAYYWRIFVEVYRRVITLGFQRGNLVNNLKTSPHKKPLSAAEVGIIETSGDCYMKLLQTTTRNKTGPLILLIESTAFAHAYRVVRTKLNHAKVDKQSQYRLPLLPFLSEEKLYFLSAAQARCEYTANAGKELPLRGGPSAAEKVNIPTGAQFLFGFSHGCHPKRHMRSYTKCKTLYHEYKAGDQEHTKYQTKHSKY